MPLEYNALVEIATNTENKYKQYLYSASDFKTLKAKILEIEGQYKKLKSGDGSRSIQIDRLKFVADSIFENPKYTDEARRDILLGAYIYELELIKNEYHVLDPARSDLYNILNTTLSKNSHKVKNELDSYTISSRLRDYTEFLSNIECNPKFNLKEILTNVEKITKCHAETYQQTRTALNALKMLKHFACIIDACHKEFFFNSEPLRIFFNKLETRVKTNGSIPLDTIKANQVFPYANHSEFSTKIFESIVVKFKQKEINTENINLFKHHITVGIPFKLKCILFAVIALLIEREEPKALNEIYLKILKDCIEEWKVLKFTEKEKCYSWLSETIDWIKLEKGCFCKVESIAEITQYWGNLDLFSKAIHEIMETAAQVEKTDSSQKNTSEQDVLEGVTTEDDDDLVVIKLDQTTI